MSLCGKRSNFWQGEKVRITSGLYSDRTKGSNAVICKILAGRRIAGE